MTTLKVKNADGNDVYLDMLGAGTSGDPYRPVQNMQFVDEAGAAYGIKQIGNKPRVIATSYEIEIAMGNLVGHTARHILGDIDSIAGTLADITRIGDVVTKYPNGVAVTVKSTTVNDTGAGTGAGTGIRTLEVHGLDASRNRQKL